MQITNWRRYAGMLVTLTVVYILLTYNDFVQSPSNIILEHLSSLYNGTSSLNAVTPIIPIGKNVSTKWNMYVITYTDHTHSP